MALQHNYTNKRQKQQIRGKCNDLQILFAFDIYLLLYTNVDKREDTQQDPKRVSYSSFRHKLENYIIL